MASAPAGSAHHQPNARCSTSAASATAESATPDAVRRLSARSARLPIRRASEYFAHARNGRTERRRLPRRSRRSSTWHLRRWRACESTAPPGKRATARNATPASRSAGPRRARRARRGHGPRHGSARRGRTDTDESTTALIPNPISARLPLETAVATAAPPTTVFQATVSALRCAPWRASDRVSGTATRLARTRGRETSRGRDRCGTVKAGTPGRRT